MSSINKNYETIDYSDGVDEKEAITIAQNYIIKNKVSVYNIKSPSVRKETYKYHSNYNSWWYVDDERYQDKTFEVWVVSFKERSLSFAFLPLPFCVDIDINNGKVIRGYSSH